MLQKDSNGNLLKLDNGSLMNDCCCVQCDPMNLRIKDYDESLFNFTFPSDTDPSLAPAWDGSGMSYIIPDEQCTYSLPPGYAEASVPTTTDRISLCLDENGCFVRYVGAGVWTLAINFQRNDTTCGTYWVGEKVGGGPTGIYSSLGEAPATLEIEAY